MATLPLWSFLVSFPPGGKVGLERKPRPAVLLGRNPQHLCVGSSLEAEVRVKGALTARDGAVGTWPVDSPSKHCTSMVRRVLLLLHGISPSLLLALRHQREEWQASSPSPGSAREWQPKHVLLGRGPHLPACCPFFVCPSFRDLLWSTSPHSSVCPVTPNRGSGPLTLSTWIEPVPVQGWSGMRVERGGDLAGGPSL